MAVSSAGVQGAPTNYAVASCLVNGVAIPDLFMS